MISLKKNVLANFAGQAWANILGLLLVPLYLKFVGIEAYGLVGFYMALQGVLGLLDLGIGATLTRELARLSAVAGTAGKQRDFVATTELVYWSLALVGGVAVFLLAPYISHSWVKTQELSPDTVLYSIRLMGISVIFQFPISLYRGGLMGLQRQVLVNGLLMFTGTFRSVGAVLVLWLVSPTIVVFFAWQIASGVLGCAVLYVAMWRSLPVSGERACFRIDILRGVWRYAAAVSANAFIGVLLTQLDKIILSRMLPLKMFGYYVLAATVASTIWFIIVPFNSALFPHLVQLHETESKSDLPRLFHKSAQFLSVILLPVSALLIIFSKDILFLWTQDPTVADNCHLIVSLLVTGTMINGLASLPAYAASAFGWPQLITLTNAIQAVVMVPLISVLVYYFQGIGAAIAWVVLNSTYLLFLVPRFFHRYLKPQQKAWHMNDVLFPALSAFFVSLISFFAMPKNLSMVFVFVWIACTGILSVCITGSVMPYVRLFVHSQWELFRVRFPVVST